jgi:folate-binding protein YgfZ
MADPRLPALGRRSIAPKTNVPSGSDDYQARRLGLGVPEGADFGSDKIFALDAGLDELHAVSFDKGCYVGQELTARMKHRGTARKRLLPVVAKADNPLPTHDVPVTADGQEIGIVVSVYDARGFALIRLDRLREAGSAALEAGGVAVNVTEPAWLFS